MARPIKFRILSIDRRDIYALSLCDCTIGETYEGTLYVAGEEDPEGDRLEHPSIVFKDDIGDDVFKFSDVGFTYEEVL